MSLRRTHIRYPNFVIIGAERCGSTSLARYLGSHHDVYMSATKEVHFFDRYFDKGNEWYGQHFSGVGQQKAVGEATPNYLYDGPAIDRMSRLMPDARLIAILRHPVDRAYSHYWLSRAHQSEPLHNFADAVKAESDRLANGDEQARLKYSYLDRGRYFRQLVVVMERYPRDNLLVLLFDDLRQKPEAVYRQLTEFLDVDPTFTPARLGEPINQYAEIRSQSLSRIGKRLPRLLGRIAGKLNRRVTSYPPMDPILREHLCDLFKAENAALGEWLGRDLTSWNV